MKTSTLRAATISLSILAVAAMLPAQSDQVPPATQASAVNSKVRIVRLSEVKGAVQVDRAIGRGYEPAMANLPIVENSKVETAMGVAEIEFEDNSTLRLGPETIVEFPQLERTPAGATVSTARVLKGTVYVSLMKSRADQFTLAFGNRSLVVPPDSHIRLLMDQHEAQLSSLGGPLRIDDSSSLLELPKKKTLTFNLAQQNAPELSKGVLSEGILDAWDKQNTEYHSRRAAVSGFNTPYAYGLSDMAYYGSFVDAGGCGMMWRPYFVSAAWDPYSNGSWAYYSTGYTWVSPYPWGWTPYHYGSWSMCPGVGWGWMPGGNWYGLNNGSTIAMQYAGGASGAGRSGPPIRPIHPPRLGQPTIVPVNSRPLIRSGMETGNSFQFRRDSAGLGIPRESLGNLHKFSQRAESHGVASTPIYVQAPAANRGAMNRGYAGGEPMMRGVPPASNGSMQPGYSGRPGGGMPMGSSAPPMSMPSGSMPSGGSPVSAPRGGSPR